MKKSLWFVFVLLVTIASVDLIIFDWWLPQRFETQLAKGLRGGKLSFDDIELNWTDGRLVGGKWQSPKRDLFLDEGSFSYSSIDWFFSDHSQIKHLVLREFRVVEKDELNSSFNIWKVLNDLRLHSLDYGCDSIDISGSYEKSEISIPFSIFASHSKWKNEIKAAIEIRLDEFFPLITNFLPVEKTLFLKLYVQREENFGNPVLQISIRNELLGEISYINDGESESIQLSPGSNKKTATKMWLTADRLIGENQFSGDWNATTSSQSWVRQFPILSLVNGSFESSGGIEFDTYEEKVVIRADGNFSVSSFFFPKEGLVRGQIKGQSEFSNKNWVMEDFRLLIENKLGEQVEAKVMSPFSDFKKIENLILSFNSFNIGRLKEHFSAGSRMTGVFEGDLIEDILNLSSENISLETKEKTQEEINLNLKIPLFSKFKKDGGVNFEIGVSSEVKIQTGLLPQSSIDFNQSSFQNLYLKGRIQPTFWLVDQGEAQLVNQDKEVTLTFKVKDSFRLSFKQGLVNWSPVSLVDGEGISFFSNDFAPEFFLGIQKVQLKVPIVDLLGKIVFENGLPVWVIENFQTEGNIQNVKLLEMETFQIQGDLKFYPHLGTYGIYELNNIILNIEGEEISQGDLSISINENSKVHRVRSNNFQISSQIANQFSFPKSIILANSLIKINRLDWHLIDKNELVLDGLIVLPSIDKKRVRNFEIPLKWTLVKKKEDFSHWIKLSYSKSSRSDLEINFIPESNQLTFRGDKLNLIDLMNLYKSSFGPFIQNNYVTPDWLKERLSINAQLSFKTLIIAPSVVLNEFEAEINFEKQKIIFKSNFKGAPIEGGLDFNLEDYNSSESSTFNLQLSGQDINASIFNSITEVTIGLDGLVNWKLNAKGNIGGQYELNSSIEVNNVSLNLLEGEHKTNIDWLKEEMEKSLGHSFSWSAPQTQMIEVFGNLLIDIYFANGSIEINRNESGEWRFSLLNWKGPNMTLLGRGTISSDGNLKLNLVPSFKNKWADFLQVVNVLAAGNVRQGYRTLKREPLEIEGRLGSLKLTNWWKLIGQGMGLEPHE
jgi:hypothetical protein